MQSASSPTTVAELAEAVRAAERVRPDETLSLDGLTRVVEHQPGDLTCIVEAGIRLSTLEAALAEHGQRLALDPPGDPALGACLAGNLHGPLRHRYGTMRDLVIGVTVVLADGTVASSGGKVVKNVAGYDLAKLLCGSRGRLGVIARLALRLHPLPEASASVACAAEHWPALRGSGLDPAAVDLVDGTELTILLEGSQRAVETRLGAASATFATEPVAHGRWEEIRALQAGLTARPGAEGPLVRPGPGVAYLAGVQPEPWSPLAERVRQAFDPGGKLA